MIKYNPSKIENKWQQFWQDNKTFQASDNSAKTKKYVLVEFPYPSGEGLHMGHVRPYVAADVTARFYRAKNFEVMFPFGWDAFGLPAENYAIKNKVQPQVATQKNVANARRQVLSWGLSFDWSREVNTTDPAYYKWTQWIFLQLFKNNLAYQAVAPINWCPKDKTALANEEVIDGRCERCGTLVEKKNLRQWFLKITEYAQKLLDGLKNLDWPEAIKLQQENWIGRSEGAEIQFKIESENQEGKITVYTTRPDTLFGATYLVLAPEHPFIRKLADEITNWDEVLNYIEQTMKKTDIQRSAIEKDKTGIELKGIWAIHPGTGEKIPIWIADYVLASYGTGAIMAVPAHDQRDFEFAKKYNLPLVQVIDKNDTLINSGDFDGRPFVEARKKIVAKFGKAKVQYKLRDWVFSRQRYWGEPIPVIHCPKCGVVAVPESQLPVLLPEVKNYEPTGTGESPLAAIDSWVNVKCPNCNGDAKRETNTMPQWAGSSWYFMRYCDPQNKIRFAEREKMAHWMPVDLYFGGFEHTTLHLLYSRFWNLFLHDQGYVPFAEPYVRRQPHGIILAADGEKMSKSRGNVVNPDQIVKDYGADTLRMYELFLGPHDQSVSWNEQGIIGVRRFLERAWYFVHHNVRKTAKDSESVEIEINKLIKKISEDIEGVKFNTAVASLMQFLNDVGDKPVSKLVAQKFLILLAPFAPHIAEELWAEIGEGSVCAQPWPIFDQAKTISKTANFVVQVNGKLRANIEMPAESSQPDVEAKALQIATVKQAINNKPLARVVFIKNRLVNFVIADIAQPKPAPAAAASSKESPKNPAQQKDSTDKNADNKTKPKK